MTLVRRLRRLALAAALAPVLAIAALRVVDPPVTLLMLLRAPRYGVAKTWVDVETIAPALLRAVVAAEDARFFEHHGVDWRALRLAAEYNRRHGGAPKRGGGTITMQCVRNVLLWPGKSYLRKGLEVALALVADVAWGKRRTLELYLNVAEWGPGVYGAERAARHAFGVGADRVTAPQAALLAAVLPSPLRWSAAAPSAAVRARAATIAQRAARVRLPR